MKKTIIFTALAVLILSVPAFCGGTCSTSLTYSNGAATYTFQGFTSAAGNIWGVAYVVGQGNPTFGVGKDSGALPMTVSGCSSYSACQCRFYAGSPNYLRVAGQTNQAPEAWDICPDNAAGDLVTVILFEKVNEAAATHLGRFVGATAKWNGGTRWDFAVAQTPANGNVKSFQDIPTPLINASVNDGGGNWHFTVRIPTPVTGGFTNNATFIRQYYDSTVTAPIVITGWRVYRFAGGTAPTTGDVTTGSWIYMGTQAIADDTNTYTDYTTPSFALGTGAYFAVTPQFADGFIPFASYTAALGSNFVGAQSTKVGPTASGVFSVMNATAQGNTINVTWTSNVETGVMGYQVYYATTTTGPYKATGASITPLGNGHNYATSFNMPATKAGGVVYVKVAANMNDSTQTWSDVKKVKYGFGPERNN
jgi:hypothetical protein